MKDKWIERFNEKLGDYSLPVEIPEWKPEGVKKRRSIPWYIPLMAGAAATLALILLLPMGGRNGRSAEERLIAEAVPALVQQHLDRLPAAVPLPAVSRKPFSPSAAAGEEAAASDLPAFSETPASNTDRPADDDPAQGGKTSQEQTAPPESHRNGTPSGSALTEASGIVPDDYSGQWDDSRNQASRRHRSFSFSLRAGNIRLGTGVMAAGMPMLSYGLSDGMKEYNNYNAGDLCSGLYPVVPRNHLYTALNSLASSPAELSYDLPVKAGVGFHFGLTPAIGLESGVNYSLHRARLYYSGGMMRGSDIQYRLHYIGIPLKVSAGFEPVERVRLYGVAGGEVQMLATGETIYSKEETAKVEGHPFQYALTAAAGLDFSLTRHLSFFAEPGVAWYFKLPENLPSYYREHPLSFDLQLGLRVSFRMSQP